MVARADNPKGMVTLLPYQQRFKDDSSRVLVGKWCRQAGKDFTAAEIAVDGCLSTGEDWYLISVTQRQADETFAKCVQAADRWRAAIKTAARLRDDAIRTEARDFTDYDAEIDEAFKATARTLHLPGGGKIVSLPGRDPASLAGFSGNIILTEFALFPKGGYEHWRVIFPITLRGYRLIAISTPRGMNTKFYELCNDPETYSVHVVDIHKAVADGLVLKDNNGLPCTIEEYRALYGDEAGWQREFLLHESGDLEALVKWHKLEAAASADGGIDFVELRVTGEAGWRSDFFDELAAVLAITGGRAEIGWDVARHGDLSPLWVNVHAGGARELSVLVIMKGCTFALQREIVMAAMDTSPLNVGCGDATGLGMDSNETLATKYGERWLPVTFTAKSKAELGSLLVTCFDDNDQVLPAMETHKHIATDIYALQADRGGDRLKLIETANPMLADSHCDIAYSLALARMAAGIEANVPQMYIFDL